MPWLMLFLWSMSIVLYMLVLSYKTSQFQKSFQVQDNAPMSPNYQLWVNFWSVVQYYISRHILQYLYIHIYNEHFFQLIGICNGGNILVMSRYDWKYHNLRSWMVKIDMCRVMFHSNAFCLLIILEYMW